MGPREVLMDIIYPCEADDDDDDDILDYRAKPVATPDEDTPKEWPVNVPTPALWPAIG